MIPVPEFRTCRHCGPMPLDSWHFKPHKRKGGGYSWDCRSCANRSSRRALAKRRADPDKVKAYRERKREHARKSRAANPERYREANQRYYARLSATPEGRAEVIVSKRLSRRLRAEREGRPNWIPDRPTVDPYEAVKHGHGADTVPAAPLAGYLQRTFPGWTPSEIARHAREAISERLVGKVMAGAERVELDAVDRFVTRGLGRPDLLNALYPVPA